MQIFPGFLLKQPKRKCVIKYSMIARKLDMAEMESQWRVAVAWKHFQNKPSAIQNSKRTSTMSFRDLRSEAHHDFTETMQELRYPRLISMENFRTPNFPLVAEILVWLVKRFDPDVDIPLETKTEGERVALIRSVAQLLVLKANLKLNTKKLYQADGYAVKEMLKVTNLLHESLKVSDSADKDAEEEPEVSIVATAMKAQELKGATDLVGAIVSSGASLFDLLGKEGELRELRNNRASRRLEMNQVEQAVKDSMAAVTREIENAKQSIDSIIASESTLDAKIEKKKTDLERHNKRLQTLKKIRPAFMEEFEKLEEELKELYGDYVVKCRNIAYLESVLEQNEQAEQKRMDQRLAFTRKLVEDLKQEEASEEVFSEGLEDNLKPTVVRPREASRKTSQTKDLKEEEERPRKVFGSMAGGQDSESLDDSDSDLLLDGDITEDDVEIENQPVRDVSDDDF